MVVKALCALALFAATAQAQITQFEEKRIIDIQFSPMQPLDPADLARALPFKKGDPLRAEDVATAIDNLFATGRFEEIIVEAEASDDGVVVRFSTELARFLGGVTIKGVIPNPPNATQIAAAAQLTLGAPFRDADLTHAREAVNELLKSNGLYESQVTPELTLDDSAQQVFLTLRIAGKKRAKYDQPVIQGDTKLPNSTIIRATGWECMMAV